VAYDVGGVREVIESDLTGIIVSPHHYEEFKASVVSLIENPEKRRQIGTLARERYPEQFAIENVAKQYEVLLLKLLADKEKRG
jgi:glycosyltransferase involved in cell wall biosynthesis